MDMDEPFYTPVYDEETSKILESQFLQMKGECYVDHAGATLYSEKQISEITKDITSSQYANPHSRGVLGNLTEEVIDSTRNLILQNFHTSPDEYSVIFTSGATASMKIIAETFVFKKSDGLPNTGCFTYTQDNHTSVLGMREIVSQKQAKINCLSHQKAFELFHIKSKQHFEVNEEHDYNSLFVYPAQCNFSGLKYPLEWINKVKKGYLDCFANCQSNWYILLDAASFVSTCDLDLSVYNPDFVCVSFYKMFGYPTGLGALLVKNTSANVLRKCYYGGGTVDIALSSKLFHIKRECLHERYEDGTLSYLSIISLRHGFQAMTGNVNIRQISSHVFSLAKYFHHSLLTLHHNNGTPVAKLYSDTDYENQSLQGGIVTFNILRASGEYVGYMEVLNMASIFKIHLRTGCFCNPGACQRHLNLTDDELLKNYDSGYKCGGTKDLIDGKPTGAVRVSFGYMSTVKDVQTLLIMIKKCFVHGPEIFKLPLWWGNFQSNLKLKYQFRSFQNGNFNYSVNKQSINPSLNFNKGIENESAVKVNYKTKSFVKSEAKLTKIFIYPIKSCASYQIKTSWKLSSRGLQYDREWVIMTSNGICLTQKQEPKMCLIKPVISLENNEMELTFAGMPSIKISLNFNNSFMKDVSGQMCNGKICGHQVTGMDCGPEASEWLSLILQRPNLKLLRQQESRLSRKKDKELSFASQSQYLLINEASIFWLSNKIQDSECDKKTILDRFRGNIVIKCNTPFEEMTWKNVKIGNLEFKVDGLCTRCQMVCIDQTTGEKTIEPLRTLAEEFHGKLKFGIYLSNNTHGEGEVRVGDRVYFN